MPVADHTRWEYSEPGSGTPFDQNPQDDKAIKGGWRRDSPPAAYPEYADPFMTPVFVTMPPIPYETRG